MKDILIKIGYFAIIAAFVLAVIGSTGYLFYIHQPLFAIASLVVDVIALPTVIEVFKKLIA